MFVGLVPFKWQILTYFIHIYYSLFPSFRVPVPTFVALVPQLYLHISSALCYNFLIMQHNIRNRRQLYNVFSCKKVFKAGQLFIIIGRVSCYSKGFLQFFKNDLNACNCLLQVSAMLMKFLGCLLWPTTMNRKSKGVPSTFAWYCITSRYYK